MRRVTVQTNLPFQLGLEQHRVKDILCVLGPLRSQQANYNNPCSEVSHHGSFDSIVMTYCVSVSVLSELFRQVPRWMPNETQWFVSAKARWGHRRSAHNLHGDRSACLPVTRTTSPTTPNVIQQTKCVERHQSNFRTANSVLGLPKPGFVQMHQNNPNCGHHKGH